YIVAIEADPGKSREGLEELCPWNRRITQRRGTRYLTEVGILHAVEQWRAYSELIHSQLIDVYVGHADVRNFGPCISDLENKVTTELALHRNVPLLDVAGSQIAVDTKDTLAEPGIRRQGKRDNSGSGRKQERRIPVVEGTLRYRLNEWKVRNRKRSSD